MKSKGQGEVKGQGEGKSKSKNKSQSREGVSASMSNRSSPCSKLNGAPITQRGPWFTTTDVRKTTEAKCLIDEPNSCVPTAFGLNILPVIYWVSFTLFVTFATTLAGHGSAQGLYSQVPEQICWRPCRAQEFLMIQKA